MNITDFLSLLTEERGIDYINSAIGDKIPSKTIAALSSKMKKGKYDNEAMAIFKMLQSFNDPKKGQYTIKALYKKRFLEDHAGLVWSVLKKLKKGDSAFNAEVVLNDFLLSKEEPKTFWKNKWSEANEKKEKESKPGLKNAIVKSVGDEFLIFPKTAKKLGEFGLSEDDLDKQWKELKAISDELAKKDTSGEEYADVNHWCVASSSPSYYEDYKTMGGTFIVIVKKGKDGKPDYNERYLFYVRKRNEEDSEEYDNWEFADKFNSHSFYHNMLSKPTVNFLEKVKRDMDSRNDKREDEKNEVHNRMDRAHAAERSDNSRLNSLEVKQLKKLHEYLEKMPQKVVTMEDLIKEINKIPLDSLKDFTEWFNENSVLHNVRVGDFVFGFKNDASIKKNIFFIKHMGDRDKVIRWVDAYDDYETAYAFLKMLKRHKDLDTVIANQRDGIFQLDSVKDLIYPFNDSFPKALNGNGKIYNTYKEYKKRITPNEITIIPNKILLFRNDEAKRYELVDWHKANRVICALNDPHMVEKVQRFLEKNK